MLSQALSETISKLARTDGRPVEWAVSRGYVGYDEAVAAMEARAAAISAGEAGELIWLLEHPPLYTAGVSSKDGDLLDAGRFPVHRSGRGGQFTYHGPGQRVAYVMLDLNQRGKDVRAFVRGLEQWIIGALGEFGVTADVREGRVGVWVERKGPGWSRPPLVGSADTPPKGGRFSRPSLRGSHWLRGRAHQPRGRRRRDRRPGRRLGQRQVDSPASAGGAREA